MLCAKFGSKWRSGSEEDFKIFFQLNFTILLLSPLGEGRRPSFEQTWIPYTQWYFVPSLFEIGPEVLEKKFKMWKVYRRTERQKDRTDRWSEKLTWAYISGEQKKKSICCFKRSHKFKQFFTVQN